MDRIPTEIVKHCLSFFDDKTARVARLACVDWFKWIQYSKFNIYFARADTLPQMIDRLSKYQYLIDLALTKVVDASSRDIVESISKLTQLRSFVCRDNIIAYLTPDAFYPLTVLTNLEELSVIGCDCPVELLHFFPRIRQVNLRGCHSNELEQGLKNCKNIECMHNVHEDHLDALPASVTKLQLISSPNTRRIKFLTKLTNLKKLRSFSEHSIDLTGITWLENLRAETADIKGLEQCNHLTRLFVDARGAEFTVPELPNLEKLILKVHKYDGTHMANMSRLTHLRVVEHADLTALSTSLQYLSLSVTQDLADMIHLSDITHLNQLTHLIIHTEVPDIEPISSLTNLQALLCENSSGQKYTFQLSNLQNLTYLFLLRMDIDANTVRQLTNLQHLHLSAKFDRDPILWNSFSHLTKLTALMVYPVGRRLELDCSAISKLPLKRLRIDTKHKKNEVAVVTKLTTLESLKIHVSEDDEILALTTLQNLTELEVSRDSSNVTGIHLTSLTNLQKLHVNFKVDLIQMKETDLKAKLTRLFNLNINDYE